MPSNKLTNQMKSPGQAWMDHVNNDMNAKAVTPAYLEPQPQQEKGAGVARLEKLMNETQMNQTAPETHQQPDKSTPDKDIEHSH